MELQRTTEGEVGRTTADWNVFAAVALLSLLAGGLHFAAAWTHRELAMLSGIFVVAALLQIGWAVALMLRPPRSVIVAGGVMNALFVVFYFVTRVTGVGIEGLDHTQPFGVQDLVTTLLEIGAVVGALALLQPAWFFGQRPARLGPQGLALVGCLALVLAGPAFASTGGHSHHTDGHDHLDTAGAHEHAAGDDHAGGHAEGDDHGDGEHADGEHADGEGHAEGDDHGDGEHADGDDHGHADGEGHAEGDDHAHADGVSHAEGDGHGHTEEGGEHAHAPGEPPHEEHPPGENHPHPPGPHPPGPHPPGPHPPGPHPPGPHPEPEPGEYPAEWSDEQVAYADQLIAATEVAMVNYNTPAKAAAAGFTWIGDGAQVGGFQHWINLGRFNDGRILDVNYPESLVFRNSGAGLVLEAAMFILPWNYDMTNIPSGIAWLPGWHKHDDLCFTGGGQLTGQVGPGESCPAGSFLIVTPPMLHVWIIDTECGRFAGVDGGGLMCEHEHGH